MNMDQERLSRPAHLALCSGAKGVDNPRIRSDGTLTKF
jgi:hypothetical protein